MQKDLEKIENKKGESWSKMIKHLEDGVVQLQVVSENFLWPNAYRAPLREESFGSGWFIDNAEFTIPTNNDLLIITNAHVAKQSKTLTVLMPALGLEPIKADVVGVCVQRDIALVKISDKEAFMHRYTQRTGKTHLYLNKLGNSDELRRGAKVMGVGYPLGMRSMKSSRGIV